MPKPIVYIVMLVAFGLLMLSNALARDLGQWGDVDPELKAWFESLRMPDNPVASCCGSADSYFCSEHATSAGQIYCIIDDERDNLKLKRTPVENGTAILIPPHKLNKDPNMIGRAVVFLSSQQHVYCFISASGS